MEAEFADNALQMERETNARRLSPVRNIVAGGIGGMLACIAGHPLDTIKVRLQVASISGQQLPFNGTYDCLQKTIKEGGFRSLFRGMMSPLLIATPITALSFYSIAVGKKLQLRDPEQEPTMMQYSIAGAFSGFVCSFVVSPVERIKCVLQIKKTDSQGNLRGPIQVLLEMYRKEKLRGIYKGLMVTMTRDVLGCGAWYLAYEGLLKLMRPRDCTRDDVSMTSIVISGACAGIVFWALLFPVDNIKTRFQTSPVGAYRGSRDVLREVLKNEGFKALYRGYVPAVLRAPLVHVSLFIGYEFTIKALNRIT